MSLRHQATVPGEVVAEAGLAVGDELRVEANGPGRVVLVRVDDPIIEFAGPLTGVCGPDYLKRLGDEWA